MRARGDDVERTAAAVVAGEAATAVTAVDIDQVAGTGPSPVGLDLQRTAAVRALLANPGPCREDRSGIVREWENAERYTATGCVSLMPLASSVHF